MPQLKKVDSLKTICLFNFSFILSTSISFLSSLTTSKGVLKNVIRRVAGDECNSTKPKQLFVSPSREVHRIRAYIKKKIPSAVLEHIFHQTLIMVAELLTVMNMEKLKNDVDDVLQDKVDRLEAAFQFTFDLLFVSSHKYLNLNPLMHLLLKWIAPTKKGSLDRRTSNIMYSKIERVMLKVLRENGSKLNNLESIGCPHFRSGELLIILSSYCVNLAEVALACGCPIMKPLEDTKESCQLKKKQSKEMVFAIGLFFNKSDGSVKCPKLKYLSLPMIDSDESKAGAVFAEMFCKIEKLEAIIGIPMLKCLLSIKNTECRPLKIGLKHFSENDPRNTAILHDDSFIKSFLPHIESIELFSSAENTLRLINCFPNAKCLRIELPTFHTVANKFELLEILEIGLGSESAWPLLLSLTASCQKLQCLTIVQSFFNVSRHSQNSATLSLPALLDFRIIRPYALEFKAFKRLLEGAPNVKAISIDLFDERDKLNDEFNDNYIKKASPLLKTLETFTVDGTPRNEESDPPSCPLTLVAAECLIDNCPQLRYLGNLENWNVKKDEAKHLLKFAKFSNWDLEIVNLDTKYKEK